MDSCRPCGCKGRRSCLVCEEKYGITPASLTSLDEKKNAYVFCSLCKKAWSAWDVDVEKFCPNHSGKSISVDGVYLQRNFITEYEKEKLLEGMNEENWDPSQSGRRKQNYGPKCNFKKNKIQLGNFNGFPSYSKFVHDKLRSVPLLKNFNVIEQCSLEYDPKRGAAIDPHIDDCWIWGERIVTVNVLGDTFLTMSQYKGDNTKYNLNKVKNYPRVLDKNGCLVDADCDESFIFKENINESVVDSKAILRLFMPEKSLVVLYGSVRYEWEHYVLREDIKHLRICLAYREFTPTYLSGGEKENLGLDILNKSKNFCWKCDGLAQKLCVMLPFSISFHMTFLLVNF